MISNENKGSIPERARTFKPFTRLMPRGLFVRCTMTKTIVRLWGLSIPLLAIGLLLLAPSPGYGVPSMDEPSQMNDGDGYFILWSSAKDFHPSQNNGKYPGLIYAGNMMRDENESPDSDTTEARADTVYDDILIEKDPSGILSRASSYFTSMSEWTSIRAPGLKEAILKTMFLMLWTAAIY